MGKCLVCGKLSNNKTNATLHKFPRNEALRKQWVKGIGREGWMPTNSSFICYDHFPENSIVAHYNRKCLIPGSVPTILPKKSRYEPQRSILREINDNNDVLATFATTEEVSESIPEIVVECNYSPITSNQTLSKDFSSPCTSKNGNEREKCQLVTLHDKVLHDHCYQDTPYIRKSFNLALPHPDVLRTWYSCVNAEPGFGEESFASLKEKSDELKEKGQKLLCAVIFDEMSIKKGCQRGRDGIMRGHVDFGVGISGGDDLLEAKNALVIMVVALDKNWKLPIGYFLIATLNAESKANLLREAFIRLQEVGVTVCSLTLDGPLLLVLQNFTEII